MNIVSIILIAIIVLSILNGISRGFFISMANLVSWLGSLLSALLLYPYIAELWEKYLGVSVWALPLSFLVILLIAGIILSSLLNRLIRLIPLRMHRHIGNKAADILPGAITGVLYAALVALILLTVPLSEKITAATRESHTAQQFCLLLQQVEESLTPARKEAFSRSIQMTSIEAGSDDFIKLPFSVKSPEVRTDLEKEMLGLLNEAHQKHGLPSLKMDTALTEVARNHCRDMFARSYFSHNSPEGRSPFDRMRQANVIFLTAGENIALAPTLQSAHEGLMHSPGHRANILRPSFGRVGIGILDGGVYGLIITEDFRN